jgi:hypothetical protein
MKEEKEGGGSNDQGKGRKKYVNVCTICTAQHPKCSFYPAEKQRSNIWKL